MSTILDALRKLQRERAAESPKDLRGSITTETPRSRRRRQGGGVSRGIAAALVLLGVGGGGYGLYRSGQVDGLLARFSGGTEASEKTPPARIAAEVAASEKELEEALLAVVEREEAEREGKAAQEQPAGQTEADRRAPPIKSTPRSRGARQGRLPASPESAPSPARADTPETIAERARLEAALVNARAAQEAQRQADLEAAAQQVATNPPPATPAIPASPPTVPPPAPRPAVPVAAVKQKPAVTVVAAEPKPDTATPVARPTPRRAAEPTPPSSAFPEVRVESIRWHPAAERRVASLHFEQQDVPEAREGDIVAGVLIYRIDPGSVELRVGGAQRTVSPGP